MWRRPNKPSSRTESLRAPFLQQLRLRLDFDATISLADLQQSWLVLPASLHCMGDLYGHILRSFGLRKQVP